MWSCKLKLQHQMCCSTVKMIYSLMMPASWKLRRVGPGRYLDGRPWGNNRKPKCVVEIFECLIKMLQCINQSSFRCVSGDIMLFLSWHLTSFSCLVNCISKCLSLSHLIDCMLWLCDKRHLSLHFSACRPAALSYMAYSALIGCQIPSGRFLSRNPKGVIGRWQWSWHLSVSIPFTATRWRDCYRCTCVERREHQEQFSLKQALSLCCLNAYKRVLLALSKQNKVDSGAKLFKYKSLKKTQY